MANNKPAVPWRKRAIWILQVMHDHEQQPAALAVAVALAAHVNEKTLSAFPRQAKLAADTGLTLRTVAGQLAALQISGHLTVKPNGPKPATITIIIDEETILDDQQDMNASACLAEPEYMHAGSSQDMNASACLSQARHEPQFQKTCNLASKNISQVDDFAPTSPSEPKKEPRARAHARENLPRIVVASPVLLPADKQVGTDPADFDEWYRTYPRHVGRKDAAKAYASARRDGVPSADLLTGARRYAEERAQDRRPGSGQFTAHPATWLRQGRWLDEPQIALPRRLESAAERTRRAFDAVIERVNNGGTTRPCDANEIIFGDDPVDEECAEKVRRGDAG